MKHAKEQLAVLVDRRVWHSEIQRSIVKEVKHERLVVFAYCPWGLVFYSRVALAKIGYLNLTESVLLGREQKREEAGREEIVTCYTYALALSPYY